MAFVGTISIDSCYEDDLVDAIKDIIEIKSVGHYIGCYHYAISVSGKKFKFHEDAAHKFELALIHSLEMYVNTDENDYLLITTT